MSETNENFDDFLDHVELLGTGALRNQRATTTTTTTATTNTNTRRRRRPRRQATATRTRVTRRARRRPDSGAGAATRRLNPRQQQRRRLRQERIAQDQIHRRIENVNAVSRDEPVSTRGITIRSEAPRLSIYGDEPVALYVFFFCLHPFSH